MSSADFDRLAVLNVSGANKDKLFANLARKKFSFTVINTKGTIIQETVTSLLIGFTNARFPVLLDVLRNNCRPHRQYVSLGGFMQGEMASLPMVEAEVGGAEIYLMIIERFEQI